MSLAGSLFAPLMFGAALLGVGLAFWWRRSQGVNFGDTAEGFADDDLHSLFDELVDAAEAEGILDQDLEFGPHMIRAADITPVSTASNRAPAYPLSRAGQPVCLTAQI